MVKARIPELEDCGCGVPLALGAKIIAAVFTILNSAIFLGALFTVVRSELDFRDSEHDLEEHDEKYVEAIAVMVAIMCAVHCTLALLLWYGVKEHKPSFVLPWAILTAAFTSVLALFTLLLLLHKFSYEQVLLWIVVVVLYYCVLVVYSYFRELMREMNPPQALSNAEG